MASSIKMETYWPNILAHLTNPEPHIQLEVSCYCSAELDIKGIPTVDASSPRETACVLRCGHVVGQDCFRAWVITCIAQHDRFSLGPAPVTCPICRAQMFCQCCGMVLAGIEAPKVDDDDDVDVGVMPKLQPPRRDNQSAATLCSVCSADSWVTLTMARLSTSTGAVVIPYTPEVDFASRITWTVRNDPEREPSNTFQVGRVELLPMSDLSREAAEAMQRAREVLNGRLPVVFGSVWQTVDSWAYEQGLNVYLNRIVMYGESDRRLTNEQIVRVLAGGRW